MADFLEVLDTIESDIRNTTEVFNREDGTSVSQGRRFLGRRITETAYKHRLLQATKLVESVLTGRRDPRILLEVMTTDDFPILFGDILDRTMLAKYQEWPVTWTKYAKRATLRDFKTAKLMLPTIGGDSILEEVKQADQYPDAAISEQEPLTWSAKKYGRRIPFSWETFINDDLDELSDMPDRLARAARRTEHRLVAERFVGASGPNTTLYNDTVGNIIKTSKGSIAGDNPVLGINGLESAYNVLSRMVDESGNPILRDVMTLVVPPALETRAMNLLNAIQIWDSSVLGGGAPDNHSGSGERMLQVKNWMAGRLQVVVDPYIPIIASNANSHTSWFLFADPGYSREAIRIGFLRGHETPEIFMKSPNAVRVGGGDVSPMSGDFDTDAIEYKVRHVLATLQVDPKATVMSNGSGS